MYFTFHCPCLFRASSTNASREENMWPHAHAFLAGELFNEKTKPCYKKCGMISTDNERICREICCRKRNNVTEQQTRYISLSPQRHGLPVFYVTHSQTLSEQWHFLRAPPSTSLFWASSISSIGFVHLEYAHPRKKTHPTPQNGKAVLL